MYKRQTLINSRAVQLNDERNMPESKVDFPDFSGDYCLTSTDVYKRQGIYLTNIHILIIGNIALCSVKSCTNIH